MTWSISKSKIVGGDAVVKWGDKPLRQLSPAEFETAVRAAEALGDDVMTEASANGPGSPRSRMADEAAVIVRAVMREMERRDVASVERDPRAGAEPQDAA